MFDHRDRFPFPFLLTGIEFLSSGFLSDTTLGEKAVEKQLQQLAEVCKRLSDAVREMNGRQDNDRNEWLRESQGLSDRLQHLEKDSVRLTSELDALVTAKIGKIQDQLHVDKVGRHLQLQKKYSDWYCGGKFVACGRATHKL